MQALFYFAIVAVSLGIIVTIYFEEKEPTKQYEVLIDNVKVNLTESEANALVQY